MAYPDLYKDESRILETKNIKVKSVTFDAVLTTRRLILVDNKKQMVPPQEILLATLKNVESGENAIRDPIITLSIITNTGTTRQMILTFPKTSGGERKREAGEWVKALRQKVSPAIEHPVLPDMPVMDDVMTVPVTEPATPATQPPRIEIVNTPPQKKRIEISRPLKRIIESEPAMPAPIETTSLPVGSFCNRCGSRVPQESAFCNRCGTPVVKEGDLDAVLAQQVVPQPVPAQPAPAPEAAIPIPPIILPPGEKRTRPIEEVIHSIEPLIEDSVPRELEAPPIKKLPTARKPEPPVAEPESAPAEPEVRWPVITPPAPSSPSITPETPVPPVPAPASPPFMPETPLPPVPEPSSGKGKIIAIAVIGIVIIALIAGIFIFANPLQMINGGTPTPAPAVATGATMAPVTTAIPVTTAATPEITELPTTAPALAIPTTGVWVRISYANQFAGVVGTPNGLRDVSDTGEKFYQVSTSTGTAVANIQKVDGSGDLMTVDVYKDGELVIHKSTTAPKGLVEIQIDLKPAESPRPEPTVLLTTVAPEETTAAEGNSTANATASG